MANRPIFGNSAGHYWALAMLCWSISLFGQAETGIRGVVRDDNGKPIALARVVIAELRLETKTDDNGHFQVELPAGSYTVVAAHPGFQSMRRVVRLIRGEQAEVDFQLLTANMNFGEELVVLGSRTHRSSLDTPVPVDVLTSSDIESTGMRETSKAIQFLAPSFNFSTSTISDGTDIVRPSTLRGLGPDQTLVLVNGKRRHQSALVHVNGSVGRGTAGVDLNAIPVGAVERIEILRDGAAAQYGSDAIAGVINLELKDNRDGLMAYFNGGQTYAGDGESMQAGLNYGTSLGLGRLNLTLEMRDRQPTNRAGLDPRDQFLPLPDGSPDPREATFERLNHRYGDAESDNLYLFFSGVTPLVGLTEFYYFGGASRREGQSAGFYRRALDARNRPEIYPEGFLPLINTEIDDQSLTIGVKSVFSGWLLDTSVSYGNNDFNFFISNSLNVSMGPDSPTEADAGTLSFDQTIANLDFSGAVDWGLPTPVRVAAGLEYRRDGYDIEAGEQASYLDGGYPNQFGGRAAPGIQVFPGFRPSNAVSDSRNNAAAYIDLETELSTLLLVTAAGRFEDYSDFGSHFSSKLSFRYGTPSRIALRGSASTGFRAPSLHQSNFNNTSTQFVIEESTGELIPFEVGTFRHGSAVTDAFGVAALKEETSINMAMGFTAKLTQRLLLTVDFFNIDIDDRVVLSGVFQSETNADGTPFNGPIRDILEPFNVNAAQFFTNAIDTETDGLDIVLTYQSRLADGALTLSASGNWNRTEVVGEIQTPPELAGLGEILFNQIERDRIERAQPRQFLNISGEYELERVRFHLRFNKFGSVRTLESTTDPSLSQTFGSKWIGDFNLAYAFPNGLQWQLGANNFLDTFPDKNKPELSFNGIFVYPRRTAPFGFNGGFYYTSLSYKF